MAFTVVAPAGTDWAQVRLIGDVDQPAIGRLSEIVDELCDVSVSTVFVDVAEITFADSALVTFLILVRAVLPADADLIVCRPAPMTRSILEIGGVDTVLRIRDDLPLLDVTRPARPTRRWRRDSSPGHGW